MKPPTRLTSSLSRDRRRILNKLIYDKFNGRCAYCGVLLTSETFQIDHVISKHYKKNGLTNDGFDIHHIDNLFPSCIDCNRLKSYRTMEEFREHLYDMQAKILTANRSLWYMKLINPPYKPLEFHFESLKEKQNG